jgi:prepilin-type N-terminal cleavage/methylation domain-containing protein
VPRSTKAYTLIELLAVIAILAVLASVLMPAFVSVKAAAKKSLCFSHFKQAAYATSMYINDYDSYYMPISYRPGQLATSRNDRTWVQLLLPYTPNFSVFLCPSDTSRKPNLDATFDEDLVPGDLYSAYYGASKRTNMGYNYMTLSPAVRIRGTWTPVPRKEDDIQSPSSTMLFIDSVWSVDRKGEPFGGGNWLVEPPCRYMMKDGKRVDLLRVGDAAFDDIFAAMRGWNANSYGGAWPWHFQHVNIASTDTHANSVTTGQLANGCDVRPNWGGEATAPDESPWFGGR